MRDHGCHGPYGGLQIAGWLVKAIVCCLFYGLVIPALFNFYKQGGEGYEWRFIVTAAVVGVLICIAIPTGIWVSTKNPADGGVTKRRNIKATDTASPKVVPKGKKVIDETNFCCLCEVYVQKKSKHCRICDKCIDNFDHHCKWLNNCIGHKNYKPFLVYIGTLFFAVVGMLTVTLFAIGEYFSRTKEFQTALHKTFGGEFQVVGWLTAVILLVLLQTIAVLLLGQLFFFHVKIAFFDHITTYDYIITQRNKQAEKQQQAAKEKEEKVAKPPGRTFRVWRASRKTVPTTVSIKQEEEKPKSEPAAAPATKRDVTEMFVAKPTDNTRPNTPAIPAVTAQRPTTPSRPLSARPSSARPGSARPATARQREEMVREEEKGPVVSPRKQHAKITPRTPRINTFVDDEGATADQSHSQPPISNAFENAATNPVNTHHHVHYHHPPYTAAAPTPSTPTSLSPVLYTEPFADSVVTVVTETKTVTTVTTTRSPTKQHTPPLITDIPTPMSSTTPPFDDTLFQMKKNTPKTLPPLYTGKKPSLSVIVP